MKKTAILVSTILLSMGLMACTGKPAEVTPNEEKPEVGEEKPETPTNEDEKPELVIPADDLPRAETNITQDDLKVIYAENEDMLKISSHFLGMKAPEIVMKSLAEKDTKLSESLGEPVIVEFMASWCSVCQAAKPVIDEYKTTEGALNVMSVSVFDDPVGLREFVGEDLESYFEVSDVDAVADDYLLNFVPIFYFVDKEGIIQFVYSGEVTVDALKEYAEKAFGAQEE